MPSKYTDEIENSSCDLEGFLILTKKKYFSLEQKLEILDEAKKSSLNKAAKIYQISVKTISTWKLKLKYQGVSGLKHNHQNQHYSESEKKTLVKIFKSSNESALVFAVKHGISSDRSLREWVIKYNGSNLKGTIPRKRDFIMPGRKTTFEERLLIIENLIQHDVDYKWAADKYHVSYQQVYGWYQKFRKSNNDPQSLRDRRGKAKPEDEWTELDQLRAQNRLLKAQLLRKEMADAYAKKVMEIRNREGSDNGQLKS